MPVSSNVRRHNYPHRGQMATRTKRLERSQIANGGKLLPRHMGFIRYEKYGAIVQRDTGGRLNTFVELTSATARALFKARDLADSSSIAMAKLKADNARHLSEVDRLNETLKKLEADLELHKANVEQMRRNIEAGVEDPPFQRSQRSHLANAMERGTNFATRPLQGQSIELKRTC